MNTFTDLASVAADPAEPFTDRLRLAVAAYLARFKGSSREHTDSDLRCYLAWCTEHGMDPLTAQRPHLELYIRSMQEIRRFKPFTVSRRFSVVAGFYRTCVLDGVLEHSPAEHVPGEAGGVPAGGDAAWWYRRRRYGSGQGRTLMTAPLQVIALSFSRDAGSEDRILAEVDRLRGRGVLRLLDMVFVAKSQDGTIERLSIGDDEDFGSLLAAVVPVADGGPAAPAPADALAAFDPAGARALADALEPGTALAFLLVEHYWAAPLFDAIAETGLVVGAEVAAMEEAAEVIAQAQADEAAALLAAAAAQAEAAQAVAESQRIQSAAAAGAVRALITAGLVEQAAAHEAVMALTAAGLIVSAADQAAADAVAEDDATIQAADEVAAESVAESLITIAAADEIAAEADSQAGARVRAASITMAEAQVLRYLPTPLPFSVIAGKLGISRSAAKERAARLYTRLGVHSRDEAVSRARSLGLIRAR